MAMDILLLGANHRTAPADVRAALARDAAGVQALLSRIRDGGVLREAAILSTCNRTEFYAVADNGQAGREFLGELIASESSVRIENGRCGVALETAGAALHLHRVAAGLDSMMLGEPQVLGQVRDAHVAARSAGTLGAILDRLFGSALHAGKRARAESGIAAGAVSVASAAVALAERVFSSLADRSVVVVGAGETGRLVARHFSERNVGDLVIANRSLERAKAVAEDVGGRAIDLGGLPAALATTSVVISATSAPGFVIPASMVADAARKRPDRHLVLVDIAVPPDIDPRAAAPENVFLYPLDALQTIVDQNRARREKEVPHAEAIVHGECERFLAWARSRSAVPVLRELREHFERVRVEEVSKNLRHFSEADQHHVERLTRSLINRLLRVPTTRLKELDPASEGGATSLAAVRDVFALQEQRNGTETDHAC
jgi:glutamyl-tRNA reductase